MDNTKTNVPEIRFPGFTDPWEQRKFSYVFVGLQNNTLSRADLNYDQGDKKKVHYGDVLIKFGEYIDVASAELPYINDSSIESKFVKSLLADGDIIIADTAEDETVGKCCEITNSDSMKLLSGLHTIAVRPQQKYASKFLGYYLNSSAYHSQLIPLMQGIKVTSISKGALQDTVLTVPTSIDEQGKIGECLSNIDDIITLHQRKCDELKLYKKGLLQQMFPQPGEAFPRVRFPGFTDPWEQRKFNEITLPAGVRNKDNLPLEPYSITNDRGFLPQNEAHDDFGYMQNTDRKAYMVVSPNSFGYNPARINVGSIGYYEGSENVIVSSLYEIFKTKDYIDDHFLMHWFKSDLFPRWIQKFQEGSVRQYFYYDKLCECSLTFPSLAEQRKISTLIDSIDTTITLHQRKCDELKLYKKGLLQKMFV